MATKWHEAQYKRRLVRYSWWISKTTAHEDFVFEVSNAPDNLTAKQSKNKKKKDKKKKKKILQTLNDKVRTVNFSLYMAGRMEMSWHDIWWMMALKTLLWKGKPADLNGKLDSIDNVDKEQNGALKHEDNEAASESDSDSNDEIDNKLKNGF